VTNTKPEFGRREELKMDRRAKNYVIFGALTMKTANTVMRWIGTLIICTILVLAVSSDRSEAETQPFNYTASGSFGSSAFTFPDGNPSTSITLVGTSTAGPVTVYEWAAGAGFNGKQCTLPGGVLNAGLAATFADSIGIIRIAGTGDELVQTLVSGTECIDFSSGQPPFPFNGVLTVNFVGGTGKFSGATGTETLNFAGQYLSCGSTGCIGFVSHNQKGSLTTP
jgi:hypothetical protein